MHLYASAKGLVDIAGIRMTTNLYFSSTFRSVLADHSIVSVELAFTVCANVYFIFFVSFHCLLALLDLWFGRFLFPCS